MAPLFEFDPTSEDAANSALEIWNTTSYGVTAFSCPAPPLTVQWAGTVDTEGSLPSSRKHENRQLTVTVDVMSAAALRALQAKVAKIAREGGTAKLTYPNGEVIVFDLHAADTFEPQLDITYYTNTGTFCAVNLTLLAKPYGRGPEVTATLSASTATATQPHVFTVSNVKGDVAALGALRLTNDALFSKTEVIWGLRSSYYSSAAGAAVFLEAENGVGGTADPGPARASGSGTNKTLLITDVGTSGVSAYEMRGTGSAVLTHTGIYTVYARVQAPLTNTGIVSVRMTWRTQTRGPVNVGEWVQVVDAAGAAIEGGWALVKLGMVTLPKAALGSQQWYLALNTISTVSTDDLYIDSAWLVPAAEGSGIVTVAAPVLWFSASDQVDISYRGAQFSDSAGTTWTDVVYEGDYLRIPPSGPEGRTVEFIAALVGAGVANDRTDTVVKADRLEATTAQLTYTPRYLVVPEP